MSIFTKPESTKISVIAQIRAKSGHEDEVRKTVSGLVEPSLKEPVLPQILASSKTSTTPAAVYTYEEWESEEALDTHLVVRKQKRRHPERSSRRCSCARTSAVERPETRCIE